MSTLQFKLIPLLLLLLLAHCRPESEEITVQEGFKRINKAEIYYKVIGSGEPVIVVHGGPGLDHSYLLPQMKALASDYQVIFYDHRGCGRSSLDVPPATVSLRGFVEDIEGLRQLLKLEQINLLAHSWGGLLAMNYAIDYPDHLRSLTLVNSVGASTEHRDTINQLLKSRMTVEDSLDHAEILASEAFREHQAAAYEDLFRVVYRKDFYRRDMADSLNLDFQDSFHQSSIVMRQLSKDLRYYNFYTDLQQVNTPTLLIYGDHDPLYHLVAPRLLSNLPNARLQVMPQSGHFPFIEAPENFFKTVKEFLSNP